MRRNARDQGAGAGRLAVACTINLNRWTYTVAHPTPPPPGGRCWAEVGQVRLKLRGQVAMVQHRAYLRLRPPLWFRVGGAVVAVAIALVSGSGAAVAQGAPATGSNREEVEPYIRQLELRVRAECYLYGRADVCRQAQELKALAFDLGRLRLSCGNGDAEACSQHQQLDAQAADTHARAIARIRATEGEPP
jgi:hypothetical protein